jgi:hypothetical protein
MPIPLTAIIQVKCNLDSFKGKMNANSLVEIREVKEGSRRLSAKKCRGALSPEEMAGPFYHAFC